MESVEARIKLSDKAIKGLLEVIKDTSIKVADSNISRNNILKTLKQDLVSLVDELEEYEKKLKS